MYAENPSSSDVILTPGLRHLVQLDVQRLGLEDGAPELRSC